MKKKEKIDRSNDPNYFNDTTISPREKVADTYDCQWHEHCSTKQLRQSYLYTVVKMQAAKAASDDEALQIWSDIQELVKKALIKKANSEPRYVPKIFRFFDSKSNF